MSEGHSARDSTAPSDSANANTRSFEMEKHEIDVRLCLDHNAKTKT
jgi:hypothetical protein